MSKTNIKDSGNKNAKLVVAFAGNSWQAEMVKSLLDDAGIPAYLKDDIIGTMIPWYAAPGGAGSVKVTVSETDIEQAKLIIQDYEKNLRKDSK